MITWWLCTLSCRKEATFMEQMTIGVWISNIGRTRKGCNTRVLRLVLEQSTKCSSGLSD